ncbi:hypothetical protein EVG20_g298 [Dentipellis fragilis]|uniref:J domain-containing protein n=1 Tax=Dentipellis fragilis TaxID=205917 RepID=A0A4Y9ZEU7_9AGAM|nr:hypothetical protein EVG20_g298 [Dentipellis fragilis]
MDDREDPSVLFFGKEDVDLYAVLKLDSSAKPEDIKKAYRKLALVYHPDKHATSDDAAKADASHKFQQISFAFTILGDEKRRERYDKTGKTDEGLDMGEDEGSDEEVEDLKQAYANTDGSIDEIMNHIPHSTHNDEARFIVLISKLVRDGELPSLPTWESSIKDEKAKLVRKKQADKEAKEAEALARELGVWDEFYGSGKAGPRKGKGKGKGKAKKDEEEDEGDVSALQALILKKQKKAGGFLDGLAAKYAEPKPRGKGKRKSKDEEEEEEVEEPPKKRKRGAAPAAEPPEIDDAEFTKLQKKLFGDKTKPSSSGSGSSKGAKGGKGKRART